MTNKFLGGERLHCLALALVVAGCGGGSGPAAAPDAAGAGGAGGADTCLTASSIPTPGCADAGLLCTCKPAVPSQTDLTGTWVLETVGAQLVHAPSFANPFHLRSLNVVLVQVTQTGNTVVLDGQYCDRIQHDDCSNPAKVIVLDSWRLTPTPLQRSGTFAPDDSGQWTLTLPSLTEVFGATLVDPVNDALPTDPTDLCSTNPPPCLVDVDGDGYPGLSVGLQGLINGTLRSVQRQTTALVGIAVAPDRVEGGMTFASDQVLVESDPPEIKTLYAASTTYADSMACSSTFVMVKLPADAAGAVDCAWVRANEATLFGP